MVRPGVLNGHRPVQMVTLSGHVRPSSIRSVVSSTHAGRATQSGRIWAIRPHLLREVVHKRYGGGVAIERDIPEATVSRLPLYRRSLVELASKGESTVSSARLAELAGVNAAKVRKDLSHLGSYGVRGVGYDVEYLLRQVGEALGLEQEVGAHEHGATVVGHLADHLEHGDRGLGIEARRRFVEQ